MRRAGAVAVVAGLLAGAVAATSATAIAPPNDPDYLRIQAQPAGALARIGYPAALKTIGRTPLRDVLVADLATGLDVDHPDLAPRLVTFPGGVLAPDDPSDTPGTIPPTIPAGAHGWDMLGAATDPGFGNWTPDADPSEPAGNVGEGTLTAGALGQAFNNGIGGAGVAPNARFLAMRTCYPGDACDRTIQASAMRWASGLGARVVSMSSTCCFAARYVYGEAEAIAAATNTLFVVIPGGNGGPILESDENRPCGDPSPNVLCVTTAAPDDGLDCGGYNPTIVDLAVPTRNNVTTADGGAISPPTPCATSYASPTAAGAAAVLFGLDPTATPLVVKQALMESARPAPAWQGKSVSGGVLDLNRAVLRFAQLRGLTLVPDAAAPPPPPPPPPAATRVAIDDTTISPTDGAVLRLVSNVVGTVRISFGYLPGKLCPGGQRKPPPPKKCPKSLLVAKRSARVVTSGSITRPVVVGPNSIRFTSRISKTKRLARGRYKVTVVVRDRRGVPSKKRTLTLTVTR